MAKITLHTAEGSHPVEVDGLPDQCPWCRLGIVPNPIGYAATEKRRYEDWIAALFRCPLHACGRHFLAYFDRQPSVGPEQKIYRLQYCEPQSEPKKSFPKTITALSSSFVEIYNQALAAELYGLDQICGPGYRKALEFLIKDYLIDAKVADEATIKATFLGNCIKDYVSDPKVKMTAERAVSLGNDETHYERRWADKDITDLKGLIQLTVNWIDSEILTKQLESDKPG